MSGADALARLHAACFTDGPRAWSAAEFADLAASPGVHVLTAPDALAVLRIAADEAELLTIAVAPDARRQGRAARLLEQVAQVARAAGAVSMFLEVAQDNAAARALYARAGFGFSGQRKGYYRRAGGVRVDAVVLCRDLGTDLDTGATSRQG